MSDSGSVPTRSAGTSSRVGSVQMIDSGLAGDVMVGDDVPFGRDDGAAARGLALHLAAVVVAHRDDVNADEAGRHLRERRLDGGRLPPAATCASAAAVRTRRRCAPSDETSAIAAARTSRS